MSVWANRDKLGNLSGYKLVKEFTTTEINSTVEVFNYPEIVDNKNGDNYFTEILVTASAVLDGIYLVPQTGKFYVCTKAFSGKSLSAPDDNFEELSVYKNRDRLSNLYGYELVVSGSANEETINVEQEIFDFDQYNKKTPQAHFISSLVLEIICITGTQHTSYAGQGETHIVKYIIMPANTTAPCKIGEISPRGVQLFNIKSNKIFYTAKSKENKYAVYINKLPIQFI